MNSFINFIKFIFGARAINSEATKLAWETVGASMLYRVMEEHPELKKLNRKQFAMYFGNPWLNEQSAKLYKNKGKLIEKSFSRIEKEISRLING